MAAAPLPIPLSLYVHIPWCVRKCPYCDFNSHVAPASLPEQEYVDALLQDLEQELPAVWGRGIESVFIGGGTPSLFTAQSLDRLLSGLRARLRLRPGVEITLEANPGTFEQARFSEYRAIGINRLSLGIQSFDDRLLERIGRIHDGAEARQAAAAARLAGFENLNLDLMFALPGQTLEGARQDLLTACELRPTHLSWYQLTLEPHTPFYRDPPTLPDHDQAAAIQAEGLALLAEAGYQRYEVSAFARPGSQCRHNRNYWEFGDYLGLGAGAHGKLTLAEPFRVLRRWKHRGPGAYLAAQARLAGERRLEAADLRIEFLLNALRLTDGVGLETYSARTGRDPAELGDQLALARERGLLSAAPQRIQASPLGLDYLNDLLAIFV